MRLKAETCGTKAAPEISRGLLSLAPLARGSRNPADFDPLLSAVLLALQIREGVVYYCRTRLSVRPSVLAARVRDRGNRDGWSFMAQRLQAIFFDIDDTLYSTSEFAELARGAALDAMVAAGLQMDKEQLRVELDEVIHEFTSNYEHHFDKLLLRIPRKHYRGINPAVIVAAGVIAYHETKIRRLVPYEDAIEVIRLLSKTDLTLGIITEGLAVKQAEKLVRMRVHPYVSPNAIFISNQLGISKPNPKIYQRACSDLNLKPSESMYVGDNPAHDLDPPREIGMITVRMRRGGKHYDEQPKTPPDVEVQNFWDLLDYLRLNYAIEV